MIELLIIILFGVCNALRGKAKLREMDAFFLCALFFYLYTGDAFHVIVVAVGLRFWEMLGWGKYFSTISGVYNREEKNVLVIDNIANAVYDITKSARLAGMTGMMCRGLFLTPMFYILGFPLLGVCIGIMQGIVYTIVGLCNGTVRNAEFIYGAVIGVGLILTQI